MESLAWALTKEYAMRYSEMGQHPISTIYFGGGTPSILPIALLQDIIDVLPFQAVEEFTIEVNPEDVTLDRARAWLGMGFNRVSMGVQSLVDSELKIIGRRHSAQQAVKAVETLQETGFENYSLDLIYGLPGQTLKSWEYSLDGLIALNPKHISAYSLTYEPHTRLTAMLKKGDIREASEDETIAYYNLLCSKLRVNGYQHYEISNFAVPGYEAKHNSSYWHDIPYLGLGPSAHSYDGSLRRINPANIKQYLSAIDSGHPAYEMDQENESNRFNDLIITALRTAEGLQLNRVPQSRLSQLLTDAQPYLKSGDLILSPTHLSIPEHSWLISDTILTTLIQL